MLKNLFYKITGDPNEKEIKSMSPLVAKINELEPEFVKLSDDELKTKTDEYRARFHEEVDEERKAFADLKQRWVDEPDDKVDLDVVAHKARHMEIPAALNNSFGFGGHNAVLVFARV